jgi:branched-chain amino acid transport system substrate-binding protein
MQICKFLRTRSFAAGFALLASTLLAPLGAAAQAAAPPIKIGFSQPLTGALATGGKAALVAMQMWASDVNAKGGMLGRQVELVNYDDQTNPSSIPAIYSKLLDVDKVDLVVSSYGTNMQAPLIPLAMQRKLLVMGTLGTGVNDKFNYDRFFQAFPAGPNAKGALSEGFFKAAMTMKPQPKTVALVGADAEFSQNSLEGARENAKKYGLKIVYDKTYPPNTVEFAAVARALQTTKPDVVFVASYPPDTVGMIRAVKQVGLATQMFGGAMVGLQFAGIKTQLGPLLDGIVSFDLYVPEPTMKFAGIESFLKRYQEIAAKQGLDPLGYYIPPFVYAEMEVLEQAVKAVGNLDQEKLADYIRKTSFKTIVGDIKFGSKGDWSEPRILYLQYQNVMGNELEQFKQPGRQVILEPAPYKSGTLKYPYSTK